MNREVTFEIKEHIGTIKTHETGWNKEVNIVSWNGNTPKYDIRDWSPNHEQMGRGITLSIEEMTTLMSIIAKGATT